MEDVQGGRGEVRGSNIIQDQSMVLRSFKMNWTTMTLGG